MRKLPYELVSLEANKLHDKAIMSDNEEDLYKRYKVYLAYLNACGWTHPEYELEMSKRVDSEWDDLIKNTPDFSNTNVDTKNKVYS